MKDKYKETHKLSHKLKIYELINLKTYKLTNSVT